MRLLPFEYALRNAGRSPRRLALLLVGGALVTLLVVTGGAFARGLEAGLRAAGSARNVILLGAGSEESLERSEVDASTAAVVAASVPGLRHRHDVPFVSPEVHVALPVRTAPEAGDPPLAMIRGVTPAALLVHEGVQVVEGRLPASGAEELLVGAAAGTAIGASPADVALGSTLWVEGRPWRVVGRFTAPGTVMEGELWADLAALKLATRRDTDSCVTVTLEDAEFDDLDLFCMTRLDLELVAIAEHDYYAALSSYFRPMRAIAWAVAALVAAGGMLGGVNVMHAAFAGRVRELATLECLGFRRLAIAAALVQESTLIALAGGVAGCLLGLLLVDGVGVRFSTGVVGLAVDGPVVLTGMGVALLLGLVGAVPAAWRAFRLSLPEALRTA